ncbi:MAG: c-type cytochrome [Planctomycetota bacterium]
MLSLFSSLDPETNAPVKTSTALGILLTWIAVLVLGVVSIFVDWMPHDGGGFSEEVDWLFYFIYAINVIFFLLIGGLMFTFALKGRQTDETKDEVVHGATHNTVLELAWTAPPLIIVLAIFVWGFRGYLDMAQMPPQSSDAYLVDVEAYQWAWQFTHENGAIVAGANYAKDEAGKETGAILDIPADRPVEFRLSARDVLHSLYFPHQRIKKDCVPGRYNRMWVQVSAEDIDERIAELREEGVEVDPEGRYADFPLYCTEYCGQNHSQMNGILRVWKPEFWADQLINLNIWNKENENPVAWGQYIHAGFGGCVACHSVDGSANTGPTWQNLWNQQRKGKPVDEQYLLEAIYQPAKYYVEGYEGVAMASYAGQLNYGDVQGVIAYIKSLSGVDESEIMQSFPADRDLYDGTQWIDMDGNAIEPPALD